MGNPSRVRCLSLFISFLLGWIFVPSLATAQCSFQPDGPDCPCFDDTGAWAPTGAFIQDIALATVGTKVSCSVADGGKPYYQMVLGCNSELCAHFVSWVLSNFKNDFHQREAWCSETISYWHREAGIPYSGGYRCSWHLDWQIYSVRDLKEWYKNAEAVSRGRWIAYGQVDYENFELGVTVPVPGAYVAIRGFTYGTTPNRNTWSDYNNSHSLMVNEMWVHKDGAGNVFQIEVTLVEGNSGARVKDDRPKWEDIFELTPRGSEWISGGRKIYGFGIDLDSGGDPIYDESRLHWETHPFVAQVPFGITPAEDAEWAVCEARLPKFQQYVKTMQAGGGPDVTCSSGSAKVKGIPDRQNQWYFPKEIQDGVRVEIDLLAIHPVPIKGVELLWKGNFLPKDWVVQYSEDNEKFLDAIVPDLSKITLPKGIPAVPVPVPLTTTGDGMDVRYLRIIFPKGAFEEDATLEELTFQYDRGPWQDSSFNDFSQPFKRGDVDGNGKLELTDVIKFLNFQFVGSVREIECPDAADADDSGVLDLTDAIRSLNYQFAGTASEPEQPGPFRCGPDMNEDRLQPCDYPAEKCN